MSTTSDSDATRSPTTDDSSTNSMVSDSAFERNQVSAFLDGISTNLSKWSFGDKLGVAYHSSDGRLFKQNNVVNRSGARTRMEVRNLVPFFAKLHTNMMQYPFVQVSAGLDVIECNTHLIFPLVFRCSYAAMPRPT